MFVLKPNELLTYSNLNLSPAMSLIIKVTPPWQPFVYTIESSCQSRIVTMLLVSRHMRITNTCTISWISYQKKKIIFRPVDLFLPNEALMFVILHCNASWMFRQSRIVVWLLLTGLVCVCHIGESILVKTCLTFTMFKELSYIFYHEFTILIGNKKEYLS